MGSSSAISVPSPRSIEITATDRHFREEGPVTDRSSTELTNSRNSGEILKIWFEAQDEIKSGNQPTIVEKTGYVLEKVSDPNRHLMIMDDSVGKSLPQNYSLKIQSFLDQRTTSRHRPQATADFSDHELSDDDIGALGTSPKSNSPPPPAGFTSALASSAPAAASHFMSIPNELLHVSSHSSPQSSSEGMLPVISMNVINDNEEMEPSPRIGHQSGHVSAHSAMPSISCKHSSFQSGAFGVLAELTDEEMVAQLDEYRDIIEILRECDPNNYEVYLYNFQRERITDQILRYTQCDPYNDNELIWKQVLPHTGVRFAFKTLWNQRVDLGFISNESFDEGTVTD